ncbi:MAG: hypothetical protein H6814_09440 [Phycisphaeraceae bacterium]|nr:hypothetical protein [Phycisphaeraceae bacterium]
MRRPALAARFALLTLGVALTPMAGCAISSSEGYVFDSGFRRDIRSVSTPLFENRTFEQGVEARLAEALAKELNRVSPYSVTSSSDADTTITGVIRSVRRRQLSVNRDSGLGQEMAIEIVVDFQWRDNRSGKTILARRNFRGAGTYIPTPGAAERTRIGEEGAITSVAQGLVAELRDQW